MHNWLTKKHWSAYLETHYCLLKWLILLILTGQWWDHKGERQRKAHLGTKKKIQWWEPYSYMAGYSADLLRNNINLQALFSSTKKVWTSTIIRFVWVFQLAAKDGVISRASNSQPTYAVCNFFLWQRPQQNLHVLEIWPCAFPHQIAEEHRQSAWGDVDVSSILILLC